jgi:hypothetical protein
MGLKEKKNELAKGMTQVAECLPSMCEALCSMPRTAKKKKKKVNKYFFKDYHFIKQILEFYS